jgi:hypothetical protein
LDTESLAQHWVDRLTMLGHAVRTEIIRQRGAAGLDRPVAFEGGDTIYEIDKRVEPIILEHAERWAEELGSVSLVAEGINAEGELDLGKPAADGGARWRVLIDPIDGTRNIMYDKRSAWFLAAVAPESPDRSPATLGDCIASVMKELPTSKANRVDDLSAVAGDETAHTAVGVRSTLDDSGAVLDQSPLPLAPSSADSLRHGWGQVTNFFPGTKTLAADLMERIAAGTLGEVKAGEGLIFDDQYLTTGGQLVELICGRDRFCCDLRPLMFEIVRRNGGAVAEGLCCHPYDMAGLLVAKRAGVIVTDGFGRALDAPFGVTQSVHWVGYANESLRAAIEPIIQEWLRAHGVGPSD